MTKVTQLKIGQHMTGIVNLTAALDEVSHQAKDLDDDQIACLIIEKLSKTNYIPALEDKQYEKAFIREYKKYIGEPVKDLPIENIEIKVLGAGCSSCNRLEQELMSVISKMGIKADLEHVTDLQEISRYGVMGVPALIINRQVKSVGIVPSKSKLETFLKQAKESLT